MNLVQPQGAVAPQPVYQPQAQPMQQPQQVQPMQQPMQQQTQPMQQVQQPQQAQVSQFYGAPISPQDSQVINQIYNECLQGLGVQHLNDAASVNKSLYYGAREFFKTIYINQISVEGGSNPQNNDYKKAQEVFESRFGTIGQQRCTEAQLCLTMKAFAPKSLPDQDPTLAEPWSPIRDYLLDANWHSQNIRNALNVALPRNGNGNGNGNSYGNGADIYDPYNQSKAAAAAAPAPAPYNQPPQQQVQQPNYAPQQTAQGLVNGMPTYPAG